MIDSIWVPPSVHVWSGIVVLIATFAAAIFASVHGIRNRRLSATAQAVFIIAQVSLIIQAVIGIKLLDQGLGPLQLFIHYLGGLGPLLFFLMYYWLPEARRKRRWAPLWVTGSAFVFAVMAFGIGYTYVAGQFA